MDLEIAWEACRILEGLVYPTGYNPVDPPGWLSCQRLEDLDRLERRLPMQQVVVDARSKKGKGLDPFRLARELNELANMGRGFQIRQR